MKIQLKVIASFLLVGTASTVYADDFVDYARVQEVRPQIEQVNQPRQECRVNQEVAPQQRDVGGAIIGGLVGGILGNQVGGGNGRTAATAVGAVTGALVGDRIENDQDGTSERQVRHCRMVDHWEARTNGYSVTYEYHGVSHTSIMPYDPGDRIKLRVSIAPMQ